MQHTEPVTATSDSRKRLYGQRYKYRQAVHSYLTPPSPHVTHTSHTPFNYPPLPRIDCLAKSPDRVSNKHSLLINVDKTKVMASDGIACRILIQNEQLEQVDTFPYFRSLITEDGECTTEFRRLQCRQSGHHCRKYGKVTAYRFERRYD